MVSGSQSNTQHKGRNIGDGNRLKEYKGVEYTHDPLGKQPSRLEANPSSRFLRQGLGVQGMGTLALLAE